MWVSLVQSFEKPKARWDEEWNIPLGFLDLGVGVATDSVVLGTIGSERGALSRRDAMAIARL